MGSRINALIIETGGRAALWKNSTGAWGIDDTLLVGPETMIEIIHAVFVADPMWYSEGMSEAGLLIDFQRRELRFFGGHRFVHEITTRRRYLRFLASCWPGWTLKWAYRGVADIVAYIGMDPGRVWNEELATSLSWIHPRTKPFNEFRYFEKGPFSVVPVSVRDASGAVSLRLANRQAGLLTAGPEALAIGGSTTHVDLPATLCDGGVHVDLPTMEITYWVAARGLLPPRWEEAWSGWHARFAEDRFEEQVERCGEALRITVLSPAEADAAVRDGVRAALCGGLDYNLEPLGRERLHRALAEFGG